MFIFLIKYFEVTAVATANVAVVTVAVATASFAVVTVAASFCIFTSIAQCRVFVARG